MAMDEVGSPGNPGSPTWLAKKQPAHASQCDLAIQSGTKFRSQSSALDGIVPGYERFLAAMAPGLVCRENQSSDDCCSASISDGQEEALRVAG